MDMDMLNNSRKPVFLNTTLYPDRTKLPIDLLFASLRRGERGEAKIASVSKP